MLWKNNPVSASLFLAFEPEAKALLERYLSQTLPSDDHKLSQAMRYAVLNGGKRLRGLLVLATAKTFGVPLESLLPIAGCVECLHAYSLVHDDLPAMDDDDMRRGKPSCHIAFDEATAILAGDALQALAFEWLLTAPFSDAVKVALGVRLAKAVGAFGMVGGQSLELEGYGTSEANVQTIHQMKTGALIQSSLDLAGLACGVSAAQAETLSRAGALLGLGFQMQDDILDTIQDREAPSPRATLADHRSQLAALRGEAMMKLGSLPHSGVLLSGLIEHFLSAI